MAVSMHQYKPSWNFAKTLQANKERELARDIKDKDITSAEKITDKRTSSAELITDKNIESAENIIDVTEAGKGTRLDKSLGHDTSENFKTRLQEKFMENLRHGNRMLIQGSQNLWQTAERIGGQAWRTGERVGSELFQSGETALERAFRLTQQGRLFGHQKDQQGRLFGHQSGENFLDRALTEDVHQDNFGLQNKKFDLVKRNQDWLDKSRSDKSTLYKQIGEKKLSDREHAIEKEKTMSSFIGKDGYGLANKAMKFADWLPLGTDTGFQDALGRGYDKNFPKTDMPIDMPENMDEETARLFYQSKGITPDASWKDKSNEELQNEFSKLS